MHKRHVLYILCRSHRTHGYVVYSCLPASMSCCEQTVCSGRMLDICHDAPAYFSARWAAPAANNYVRVLTIYSGHITGCTQHGPSYSSTVIGLLTLNVWTV